MTTITFDTHGFVKRLKSVGFTEEQAEVFAEQQVSLIEDKLTTKQDLVEIEANLRRDMKELEYRLIIKMGSLMAVQVGLIAALIKLF